MQAIRGFTVGKSGTSHRPFGPAATENARGNSPAEDITSAYSALTLTIAVAYGGREEIVDAVRSMLEKAMHSDASLADAILGVRPQAIAEHLYLGAVSEPDLIIRTSGEARLSGFLLWQSTYSELHFTDILWPAFRKIDFLRAVRVFQARKRRFGR